MMRSALLVIALLLGGAPALAAPAPAYAPGVAKAAGACRADQLCAFRNPEDLVDLAGTPWLIVSQHDPADPKVGMMAIDIRSGRSVPVEGTRDQPDCIPNIRGGGIGIRREDGGYRLVRIVHQGSYIEAALIPSANDAVETWRVTVDREGPHLRRTACIVAPLPLFLNDIAALADGGFAATHMFDRAGPAAPRTARFLAGQPTGYVTRWSPAAGWQTIPNSEGVFPNGIDAAQDGRTIAFAETYGHRLTLLHPDGSGRRIVDIALNPDNVVWAGGSHFIVAGGNGVPLKSTAGCAPFRLPGCAFPAAALLVDGATGKVIPLAISAGAEIPGFSVALRKAGRLYIGSSTGDRITVLDAKTPPVTLP
jgi:hypothetical protein